MLMPWKLSPSFSLELFNLQQASHRLWPEFAAELVEQSTLDIGYQTDGRIFVALDKKAVKRFQKQFDYHKQAGFPVEWLSGDEARRREPILGQNVEAAIFSPLGQQVDNLLLVAALKAAFVQTGGTLREHSSVDEILVEHNQVHGVQLAGETVDTDTVILAAGAWSGQIGGLSPLLREIIEPLKGQTVTLQMPSDKPFLTHQIIGAIYLVPRPDGRLIVGTTVEEDAGFNTDPTAAGVMHILRKAMDIAPAVGDLPVVEIGASLRPVGPGRLPVLGVTEIEGLIMASGGHSHGILLSPIVAQSISRLVISGQTAEVIKPFVPQKTTAS
jgi:glycine oxidase